MTNHLHTVRTLYDLIIGGCLANQIAGLLEVSLWDIKCMQGLKKKDRFLLVPRICSILNGGIKKHLTPSHENKFTIPWQI